MITKIGFTGPRDGMSKDQSELLLTLLRVFSVQRPPTHSVVEFFHGDCIGSDAQAHEIAHSLGYRITIFPPSNPALRAFCEADEILPAKDYLERDRDIVDNSDLLLAAAVPPPRAGSGSWYTYNYASKKFKRAWLL